MKKIKFLILMLVGLTFFSLTSCSNDDEATDPRDQYVGTWNATTTGSLTLFQNGQSVGTAPLNETRTISISKSGSNALIIDGKTYTVNGNNLSSTPTPLTETSNGITIVATENSSGTLGSNIINFNNTITGTWNATNGASGNLSGNAVTTLTR
ncbi:MAG: hypothetical protein EKK56_01325 [Flavobacteriaceae bacterium]|jgi:hypothetical protein|nr:MAG: hypothetical protein EKK56_01325 [Flavobacteriaceae bacterium]